MLDHDHNEEMNDNTLIQREKRSSTRKQTCSQFSLTIDAAQLEGAGSNISQTGAYFVTCDEIPVQVKIKCGEKVHNVYARIVRIDSVSKGSQGIALEFETRILDV